MSTAANVGLFREDVFLAAGAPLLAVTPEHIAPANGVFYPMGGDGLGEEPT